MNLYMTAGTINYFLKAKEESNNQFFLSGSGNRGLAYYEADESQRLFNSGDYYGIIESHGELSDEFTMLVTHLNVSSQKSAIARATIMDVIDGIENMSGVKAYRTAKKGDNNSYVILIQFANTDAYKAFLDSDIYEKTLSRDAMKKLRDMESAFSNANSQTYYVPIKDLEDEDTEDNY